MLHRYFPLIAIAALCLAMLPIHASAASLREVIRTCGDDGKKYCEGVGYGKPMQTCLSANKKKLTPKCNALMKRLEGGERVTLF